MCVVGVFMLTTFTIVAAQRNSEHGVGRGHAVIGGYSGGIDGRGEDYSGGHDGRGDYSGAAFSSGSFSIGGDYGGDGGGMHPGIPNERRHGGKGSDVGSGVAGHGIRAAGGEVYGDYGGGGSSLINFVFGSHGGTGGGGFGGYGGGPGGGHGTGSFGVGEIGGLNNIRGDYTGVVHGAINGGVKSGGYGH